MARQFDVVANPESREANSRPYLLVMQSDLIAGLASTVVAPLIPLSLMKGADRLNPIIRI